MEASEHPRWPPAMLDQSEWQMSWGERFALEGLLAQLRPAVAIEIGTAQGGSLLRIANHSGEVHALDLERTEASVPGNVTLHVGDSKETLPALLGTLAEERRNVDFALVDGDHTADGVRADLRNLLTSPAVERTVIVLHDTMNEETRAGIATAGARDFDKVRLVELDFLTGYMGRLEPFTGQLWGGLGLIVVDVDPESAVPSALDGDRRYFDSHAMVRRLGGRVGAGPAGPLRRLAARLGRGPSR